NSVSNTNLKKGATKYVALYCKLGDFKTNQRLMVYDEKIFFIKTFVLFIELNYINYNGTQTYSFPKFLYHPHWHSFTRSTWYVLHKKRNKRIPIRQLFRLQVLKCVFVFDLINHEKKAYDIYFERENLGAILSGANNSILLKNSLISKRNYLKNVLNLVNKRENIKCIKIKYAASVKIKKELKIMIENFNLPIYPQTIAFKLNINLKKTILIFQNFANITQNFKVTNGNHRTQKI
ncbi:hypothetical protein BpHYR1_053985, partial [Brachionus plicatilis]